MNVKRRIVILGKTGAGKSSVGNTIFGEEQFSISDGFTSSESPGQAKTKPVNGREITLIDTPGFFGTNISKEEMKSEMSRCITECSSGAHAFLIVLKMGRFTEQEKDIINNITGYFSEEVFRFATIVFTHGDQLHEVKKLPSYLNKNVLLKELLEKCGGRYHVVDNRYWNNSCQVNAILESIEQIMNANNGNCYTNQMLQAVEGNIQQQVQLIKQSSGNMSEEEIRQKAKSKVRDILNKAAGITTGVLLGALLGVVGACAAVVAAITFATKLVAATKTGAAAVANSGAAAGTVGCTAEAAVLGTGAAKTAITTGAAAIANSGAAAGTAVEATAGTAAGTAAGTVGLTAGAVVLGTAAAAGAAFGAFKGYQAGEEAETPWEAVKKTSEALWSSGCHAIKTVDNLAAKLEKKICEEN